MNWRWLWRNHGLTIASAIFTVLCWATGFYLRTSIERDYYDYIMNLGHAAFSVVFLYGLAAFSRERNKPED
jgi:hypothetical protein